MKRVYLLFDSKFGMFGTNVELKDAEAAEAIRLGFGELSADQVVYGHEDEMSLEVKAEAYRMLAVADAAADHRQPQLRGAATAAAKVAGKGGKK